MLQTTAILGGLVAVAQAAALQLPELSLRASAPPNCLTYTQYPTKGPGDHTRWTASDGKQYDISCFSLIRASSYNWQRQYRTMDSCYTACGAGTGLPGCNYAIFSDFSPIGGGIYCYHTILTPAQKGAQPEDPFPYSGALLVESLNCKDASSDGTVFTPPGSSQKYQLRCNYQFGGDTLGASKRAETLEQCTAFCDSTAGCVDAIWSDAKYCWLKKTKTNGYKSGGWHSVIKVPADFVKPDPTPSLPAPDSINCVDGSADNTVFTAPSGAQYDIKCNYQYDGQTLGTSKYTETFEVCADLCDGTAGCVEGIWSSAKYCWLKSSITGNGYKSGGWYSVVKKQNVIQ